ncbi:MAG: ATP-binding protein [Ruminococcus sp.]|nr:ATP-binding protein [Ruminococcus sp.]
MMGGTFFTITSLFYISLLIIVFFSKKRLDNIENKLFSYLIISNLVGIILAIICYFTISNIQMLPLLNTIFSKAYIVYLIVWITLFTEYTIIISANKKEHIINKRKNIYIIFTIIGIIATLGIIILPLYYNTTPGSIYSYGPAANIAYYLGLIYAVFCTIIMLINFSNVKKKKYVPLIIYIIFGTIVMFIQKANPALLLMTATESFVTFLMYFTIENPDMQMIKELNLAKDAAEKANLAKTEFLSNMSHEIRTPLNAIVGFSECMIEAKDLSNETKGFAKDIVDASNNLLEIVNGILDISKIEANKMEIVPKEYNPREVFSSLSKLVKPRLGEKPIEFKMVLSPDLPGVLKGDVGKLKQIILNILTNAAKYTDQGEIIFNVNCINRNDTNTCLLYISVKDTGRGIKKENLEKLFNKFERLDEEKNNTTEGTGLGLAITKSLAEMMGGRINVFSKYGEGSTFRIYLEQEIVSMEIPKDNSEEIKIDYSLYKGKRVLIVDDSKINIKVACQILKPYNFSLVTAESGYEALELAKVGTFDIILMDIMMPKMNGIETLRRLKEIKGFNVPVVALTADAIEGSDEKYLNADFNDYLSKPIDRYELNRVLNKYLGGKNNGEN